MNIKDVLNYLHYIIPLGVILIPFLPIKYLKKIFFLPIIIIIAWIIFDGCPLTQLTSKNQPFLKPLYKKLFKKNISNSQSDYITYLIMYTTLTISALRIIWSCKKY